VLVGILLIPGIQLVGVTTGEKEILEITAKFQQFTSLFLV
jgi:hypothetical protein